MLLATVLTIVLSASYQAITETKITKMEEDSQKALAAAEAGIEYTLKTGQETNISDLGNNKNFQNFTGKTTIETTTGSEFSTPQVGKDQQYTLYLANYDKSTGFSNYYTGDLTVYWQNTDESCDSPRTTSALELTLLYDDPPKIKKWLYEPCSGSSNSSKIEGNGFSPSSSGNYTIDGANYKLKSSEAINIGNYSQAKLLIARPFYNGTKVGFKADSENLKPWQGGWVKSTASTLNKTTKTVRVFHSFSQLPANFFVTQF